MKKNYHGRFKDAKWYSPGQQITVGGAGGIGSWLCVLLGRIGCKIRLYEMDTIDETNMAGQLYPVAAVGSTKAHTIRRVVQDFTGQTKKETIDVLGEMTSESEVTPITFSAFDNMAARKLMFSKWQALENREIFIDGRMLVESGQVFVVQADPLQEGLYETFLFDDSEVEDQACSFKATSHSGSLIASLMTGVFTNKVSNDKRKLVIREVPFLTKYDIASMMVTTQTVEQLLTTDVNH